VPQGHKPGVTLTGQFSLNEMSSNTKTMRTSPIATAEEHDMLVDRFGYRTRQVLESASNALPERTLQRLAGARALAMARQRTSVSQVVVATGRSSAALTGPSDRFNRLAFFGSAVLLALGLFMLNHWHQSQLLEETVDIDQAILTDEVPFTAHLDPLYPEMLRREH
jgi:hypothetical protein